jgi:hypothetical protein
MLFLCNSEGFCVMKLCQAHKSFVLQSREQFCCHINFILLLSNSSVLCFMKIESSSITSFLLNNKNSKFVTWTTVY